MIRRNNLTPQPPSLRGKGEPDFAPPFLGEGLGRGSATRPGFVLVAVLVVVVVLALAAYQFTDLMTAESRAAARSGDAAQARLAAASGVHYAAAMLADPTSFNTTLAGNPFAAGAFAEQVVRPNDSKRAEVRFALVAAADLGDGNFEQRYGAVTDEGGKLNVNSLIQLDPSGERLYAALMTLPPLRDLPDVADAIVDWVDGDDDARASGAESEYYLSLGQSYRAKNGPLNSLDELLLVKGVTPQLLYGTDRNRNGLADDDPTGSQPLDRGLADYLTVYGRELNVDAAGVLRINVNESEDLPGLYQKLTARVPDLADYVLAYKLFGTSSTPAAGGTTANGTTIVQGGPGELATAVSATLAGVPINRRRLKSLLDMRNTQVTLPKIPGVPNAPTIVVPCPLNDPSKGGPLLATLLDALTTTTNVELVPRINLNTASRDVLLAVPNLTEADADAILAQRDAQPKADPATLTGAWVMTAGVSPETFKKVEKYVTGRTMVYRVQAIGYFGQGGPVARVEAVIDTNQGAPRILSFRDLTDLDSPRGFEPQR